MCKPKPPFRRKKQASAQKKCKSTALLPFSLPEPACKWHPQRTCSGFKRTRLQNRLRAQRPLNRFFPTHACRPECAARFRLHPCRKRRRYLPCFLPKKAQAFQQHKNRPLNFSRIGCRSKQKSLPKEGSDSGQRDAPIARGFLPGRKAPSKPLPSQFPKQRAKARRLQRPPESSLQAFSHSKAALHSAFCESAGLLARCVRHTPPLPLKPSCHPAQRPGSGPGRA